MQEPDSRVGVPPPPSHQLCTFVPTSPSLLMPPALAPGRNLPHFHCQPSAVCKHSFSSSSSSSSSRRVQSPQQQLQLPAAAAGPHVFLSQAAAAGHRGPRGLQGSSFPRTPLRTAHTATPHTVVITTRSPPLSRPLPPLLLCLPTPAPAHPWRRRRWRRLGGRRRRNRRGSNTQRQPQPQPRPRHAKGASPSASRPRLAAARRQRQRPVRGPAPPVRPRRVLQRVRRPWAWVVWVPCGAQVRACEAPSRHLPRGTRVATPGSHTPHKRRPPSKWGSGPVVGRWVAGRNQGQRVVFRAHLRACKTGGWVFFFARLPQFFNRFPTFPATCAPSRHPPSSCHVCLAWRERELVGEERMILGCWDAQNDKDGKGVTWQDCALLLCPCQRPASFMFHGCCCRILKADTNSFRSAREHTTCPPVNCRTRHTATSRNPMGLPPRNSLHILK